MLSRPSLAEILEWRSHVDEAMQDLLDDPQASDLIELGVAHEQQHIELLLTDIKHAFASQPMLPSYAALDAEPPAGPAPTARAARTCH